VNIKCFFPIKAAAFLEPAQGVYVLSGLLVCAAPTVDAFSVWQPPSGLCETRTRKADLQVPASQ